MEGAGRSRKIGEARALAVDAESKAGAAALCGRRRRLEPLTFPVAALAACAFGMCSREGINAFL
jgi:hypothetical protein